MIMDDPLCVDCYFSIGDYDACMVVFAAFNSIGILYEYFMVISTGGAFQVFDIFHVS